MKKLPPRDIDPRLFNAMFFVGYKILIGGHSLLLLFLFPFRAFASSSNPGRRLKRPQAEL